MRENRGLTTHVLDTAHGCPAAGVPVQLFRVSPDGARETSIAEAVTDADGRCDRPLLTDDVPAGTYRLQFAVAAYFRGKGVALDDPPFLDLISIRFGVADPSAHYHVPLLVSPYGYSTYRGS